MHLAMPYVSLGAYSNRPGQSRVFVTFFSAMIENRDRTNTREKGRRFAPRSNFNPVWWGSWGCRPLKRLVTFNTHSGNRAGWRLSVAHAPLGRECTVPQKGLPTAVSTRKQSPSTPGKCSGANALFPSLVIRHLSGDPTCWKEGANLLQLSFDLLTSVVPIHPQPQ